MAPFPIVRTGSRKSISLMLAAASSGALRRALSMCSRLDSEATKRESHRTRGSRASGARRIASPMNSFRLRSAYGTGHGSMVLTDTQSAHHGVTEAANGPGRSPGRADVLTVTMTPPTRASNAVPRRVTGAAAAPLPLLGAARLRCGSACHRTLAPVRWGVNAASSVCTLLSRRGGDCHRGYPQFLFRGATRSCARRVALYTWTAEKYFAESRDSSSFTSSASAARTLAFG